MLLVAYHPHGDFAIQFCGAKRDTVFYGPRFAACSTACQVDAMTNRAFWSPIWPSLVAKDKKTLLFNMDFAYDFEGACSFTYCAEWRSLLMPHRIYSSTS